MRATIVFLLMVCCVVGPARAQAPLDVGSPESAFAGGPIHLSRNAVAMLRAHYQGDKVPLVPQPFRGRLDTAVLGHDWQRAEAEKKALVAARGVVAALLWEQSRFVATGSIGVAEMHARDIATTGQTGLSETAVMLWFYAVAVTLTDGHKCVDESAKDAYLDRLRGPVFEPVLQLVRTISDDRLAAMRDLAIRLETVLAVDRTDDLMCRTANGHADIKPDAVWRPQAVLTRGMLPRHLVAMAAVMRPRPVARPEPPKMVVAKPTVAPPEPVEPVFPGSGLNLPMLPALAFPTPGTPDLTAVGPPRIDPAEAEATTAAPTSAPDPVKAEPGSPDVVNRASTQPNPARLEPPELEPTTPEHANH